MMQKFLLKRGIGAVERRMNRKDKRRNRRQQQPISTYSGAQLSDEPRGVSGLELTRSTYRR